MSALVNYNNKSFKPLTSSSNSEVDESVIFLYKQKGNILSCTYSGRNIKTGHLIGKVDDNGNIEMVYHQINLEGKIMTGKCNSSPEILENGKIKLHENWQWTNGDLSKGESILIEV